MFFDDGVNRSLCGLSIIDIQWHATATGKCRQGMANFYSALLGGGGTDHLESTLSQGQRNGRADTTRGTRDQGYLAFKHNITHGHPPKVVA